LRALFTLVMASLMSLSVWNVFVDAGSPSPAAEKFAPEMPSEEVAFSFSSSFRASPFSRLTPLKRSPLRAG
jgi:hypothetical protein